MGPGSKTGSDWDARPATQTARASPRSSRRGRRGPGPGGSGPLRGSGLLLIVMSHCREQQKKTRLKYVIQCFFFLSAFRVLSRILKFPEQLHPSVLLAFGETLVKSIFGAKTACVEKKNFFFALLLSETSMNKKKVLASRSIEIRISTENVALRSLLVGSTLEARSRDAPGHPLDPFSRPSPPR